MAPRRIQCNVRSTRHADRDIRVEVIGGIDGGRWKELERDAITQIKSDPDSYSVLEDGQSVLIVVKSHEGREYLKTKGSDRFLTDESLGLPECPRGE
jgi:hypothetical protein